jgi:hypothetical protein
MHKCNKHILEALDLSKKMIILADEGEASATDDSCVVLYGIVRDCAYRIRRQAEEERKKHLANDAWK